MIRKAAFSSFQALKVFPGSRYKGDLMNANHFNSINGYIFPEVGG